MAAQVNALVEQWAAVAPAWAYLGLALCAFLENILPPVPGDTVVLFGAYLAGRGALSGPAVFAATWAGGTAGFVAMYAVGRASGRAWTRQGHRRGVQAARLAQAERWLARYGVALILVNRFLSGVRSAIALGAGLGRMDWRSVVAAAAVSMALWNGLLLWLGTRLGRHWEAAVAALRACHRSVLAAVVGLAAVWLLRAWHRRHARARHLRRG